MNAPTGGKATATTLTDFILLNEEIGALVRARFPLESHLARLGAELPGTASELAERISRQLAAGESLASAMEAECAKLPGAYRAAIVAGVESGQLGSALESLVETSSRLDQLRRITGVALLYPLLIFVICCVLLAMILGVVVPRFSWLHQSHFWPLDGLADSPWATAIIALVLPSVAVLLAVTWWWRSGRVNGVSSARIGALAWLPWIRRVHYWGQAANLADLLRLLLEHGVPLDRSLRLAGDATDDARIRTAVRDLADRVQEGNTDSRSLTDGNKSGRSRLPTLIRLALLHATDRKLATASLEQAVDIYRERAVRSAEWYADAFPILLTVGIGGTLTIGFTLFVLWPYAATLHELAQWNWR